MMETLEALGLSQAKLAERTGRSKKTVNEIIKGKAPITPRMAIELERVLGVPAGFWTNRERIYREWRARNEGREKLKKHQAWLRLFPVSAMIRFGWIQKAKDPVQQMEALLSFLGLASPDQWETMVDGVEGQVAFRKSAAFDVDKAAITAFADELGIAPGMVVGRLQHDGVIPHSHCNGLKKRLDWTGRGNP